MSTRVSLCLEQGQSANTRAQQQNKARPCKKKKKKSQITNRQQCKERPKISQQLNCNSRHAVNNVCSAESGESVFY